MLDNIRDYEIDGYDVAFDHTLKTVNAVAFVSWFHTAASKAIKESEDALNIEMEFPFPGYMDLKTPEADSLYFVPYSDQTRN